MTQVSVDATIVQEVLARRDELVRAITAGMASGQWEQVMGPFEGLMVALKQLEQTVETTRSQAS
jgi:hypothetical protein